MAIPWCIHVTAWTQHSHSTTWLWHIMAHHGTSWHTMAHHGTPWYIMAHYGTLWHTVAHCGTPWHTVAHCGTPWHTVAHHGTPWHTVAHRGTHAWHRRAVSHTSATPGSTSGPAVVTTGTTTDHLLRERKEQEGAKHGAAVGNQPRVGRSPMGQRDTGGAPPQHHWGGPRHPPPAAAPPFPPQGRSPRAPPAPLTVMERCALMGRPHRPFPPPITEGPPPPPTAPIRAPSLSTLSPSSASSTFRSLIFKN